MRFPRPLERGEHLERCGVPALQAARCDGVVGVDRRQPTTVSRQAPRYQRVADGAVGTEVRRRGHHGGIELGGDGGDDAGRIAQPEDQGAPELGVEGGQGSSQEAPPVGPGRLEEGGISDEEGDDAIGAGLGRSPQGRQIIEAQVPPVPVHGALHHDGVLDSEAVAAGGTARRPARLRIMARSTT